MYDYKLLANRSSKMILYYIVAFLAFFGYTNSRQEKSQASFVGYRGAVVEYNRWEDTFLKDVDNFQKIISYAAEQNVDIIVFPEYTIRLNNHQLKHSKQLSPNKHIDYSIKFRRNKSINDFPYIPDPELKLSPCDLPDEYSEMLRALSCSAQYHKIYVVITLDERVDYDPDPKLYSSVVALDREGRVIARYRRYNYVEKAAYDSEFELKPASFLTDFGVRFGLLTGEDLLSYRPAADYLKLGITNFLLSSRWHDSLVPYSNSPQFNAGWAFTNGVNLLVASSSGGNFIGSGIYVGKTGPMQANYTNTKESYHSILIAQIPMFLWQENSNSGFASMHLFYDIDVPKQMRRSSVSIDDTNSNLRNMMEQNNRNFSILEVQNVNWKGSGKRLCVDDVCCFFEIIVTNEGIPSERLHNHSYRLEDFKEKRKLKDGTKLAYNVCAVTPIAPQQIIKYKKKFVKPLLDSIRITLYLNHKNQFKNQLIQPLIDAELWRPNSNHSFLWNTSLNKNMYQLTINNPILVGPFGVIMRRFDRDENPIDKKNDLKNDVKDDL